jgi:hypothetical protein
LQRLATIRHRCALLDVCSWVFCSVEALAAALAVCHHFCESLVVVKNLNVGWGDRLKRAVLVDKNPNSFLANPSNGILVSNFHDDPET